MTIGSLTCATCGKGLEAGARFCGHCGAAIPGTQGGWHQPDPAPALAEPGCSVMLTAGGPQLIPVIKQIRRETGLGLREAKQLAERGGTVISGVDAARADRMVAALQRLGATAHREPAAWDAPAAQAPATQQPGVAEELAALGALRDNGTITEDEFQDLKRRLIARV